jgi:hypothetical protein
MKSSRRGPPLTVARFTLYAVAPLLLVHAKLSSVLIAAAESPVGAEGDVEPPPPPPFKEPGFDYPVQLAKATTSRGHRNAETQPFSPIVFGISQISKKASAGTGQRLCLSLEMDGEGNKLAHRPEKEPVRTGSEGFPDRFPHAAPPGVQFLRG